MIHAQPRPWRRALVWLLFLGPFFFASYGIATWATGLRADVGVVVFEWERHIPFLPWSIVPYWLIDLLYAISLFLCATQAQLDTHARRLLTAQVAAVTGFLLFPLRFSFQRPPVDGSSAACSNCWASSTNPSTRCLPCISPSWPCSGWSICARYPKPGIGWCMARSR